MRFKREGNLLKRLSVLLFFACFLVYGNVFAANTVVTISASEDDAEEEVSSGAVTLDNTVLNIPHEYGGAGNQFVGLRFQNLTVPNNATIENVYVQFRSDTTNPGNAGEQIIIIDGEASDNAAAFTATSGNISNRNRTSTSVRMDWTTNTWGAYERSTDQATINISPIIQEIVSRPGWSSGNNLALIMYNWDDDSSGRYAYSWDGKASEAPSLHVTYYEEPDLALYNPVTVSYATGQDPAEDAVDGNYTTRWDSYNSALDSAAQDSAWIYVDLTDTFYVDSVFINWETSAAVEYKIQAALEASDNDAGWTDMAHITDGVSDENRRIPLNGSAYARYIRMRGINRTGDYGYSIYDFKVYEGSNTGPSNISLSDTIVEENLPSGTLVGSLSADDPDSLDLSTFSFITGSGSADNNLFTISGNQLFTNASFDYETKTTASVHIIAYDGGGKYTDKAFTIKINNVSDNISGDTLLYDANPSTAKWGWYVNGTWMDNGASISNGDTALQIITEGVGDLDFYVADSLDTLDLASGNNYNISFDIKDDSQGKISDVSVVIYDGIGVSEVDHIIQTKSLNYTSSGSYQSVSGDILVSSDYSEAYAGVLIEYSSEPSPDTLWIRNFTVRSTTPSYSIDISADPASGGTTNPSSSFNLIVGGTQEVTASPAGHYEFSQWTTSSGLGIDNANNAAATVTLNDGADQTVTAQFECLPPRIDASYTPDTTITAGDSVTLWVAVSYCPSRTISYQWFHDGSMLSGEISHLLNLDPLAESDSGSYFCLVEDGTDTVYSDTSDIILTIPSLIIDSQSMPDTIMAPGSDIDLMVAASCAPTRSLSRRWFLNGSQVTGEGGAALSIASAAKADSGTYYCIVDDGTDTLTSNTAVINIYSLPQITTEPADRMVMKGIDASFSVEAAGDGTLEYQWYEEDIALDGKTGSSLMIANVAQADSGRGFYCVISNEVGTITSDTAVLHVTNLYNPFHLSLSRADEHEVSEVRVQYSSDQPLAGFPKTAGLSYWADSLIVYYKAGEYPADKDDAGAQSYTVPIKSIDDAPDDMLTQTVTVEPLNPAVDSFYNFSYSVLWHDPSSGNDSILTLTNDGRIFMIDTLAPVNSVSASGEYISGDSSVIMVFDLNTLSQTAESLFVSTSFSADFNTMVSDTFFLIESLTGDSLEYTLINNNFSGVKDTLFIQWYLTGSNGVPSNVKTGSFIFGWDRPVYSGIMSADSLIRSDWMRIYWDEPDSADSIRVWYAMDTVPLGYGITGIDDYIVYDSDVTEDTVTGLTGMTTYFFGLQVAKHDLWSPVTENSRTSAVTSSWDSSMTVENTIIIDTAWFVDTANSFHIEWSLDTGAVPSGVGLKWGSSYSLDSSYMVNTPGKWDTVDTDTFISEISIASGIVFDTSYNIGLWLQGVGPAGAGAPSGPGDSVVVSVPVGKFTYENISYFPDGEDTVTVNNGIFILANDDGNVSPGNEDIITGYSVSDSMAEGMVLINSGLGYSFTQQQQTAPFFIGIKYDSIPSGLTADNILMYRIKDGMLFAEYNTFVSDGAVWVKTNDLRYPFVILADTVKPEVVFISDTAGSVMPQTELTYDFVVSDNIGNAIVQLYYGNGMLGYPYDEIPDTLSSLSDSISYQIRSRMVNSSSGLRAILIINDGAHIDTINISRQVITEKIGEVSTIENKWTPLRVCGVADDPDLKSILSVVCENNKWNYDTKTLRLFHWEGKNGWLEYDKNLDSVFRLRSSDLFWLKIKERISIDYGSGVTQSLKDTVIINLPGGQFTDFAIPYKFDIYLSDVIASTGEGDSLLFFYNWLEDSETMLYSAVDLYLPGMGSAAVRELDGNKILSYDVKKDAYTVYNSSENSITMKIPPTSQTISSTGGTLGKISSAEENIWDVSLQWKKSGEETVHTLWIGSENGGGGENLALPLPPSFRSYGAGIKDSSGVDVYGNVLMRRAADMDGFNYDVVFFNEGSSETVFEYRLVLSENAPEDFRALVFDNDTTCQADIWEELTVGNHNKHSVKLAVGNIGYLDKIRMPSGMKMAFQGIWPNPAVSSARLRFTLPGGNISSLRFTLYDMHGRKLRRLNIDRSLFFTGSNVYTWDFKSGSGMILSSGTYIITMQAVDDSGKLIQVGRDRITLMQ